MSKVVLQVESVGVFLARVRDYGVATIYNSWYQHERAIPRDTFYVFDFVGIARKPFDFVCLSIRVPEMIIRDYTFYKVLRRLTSEFERLNNTDIRRELIFERASVRGIALPTFDQTVWMRDGFWREEEKSNE